MVWIIVRRELLDALLGLRFQLVLMLTVLLMGVTGLLFPMKYAGLVDEYNQTRQNNRQGLEKAAGQLKNLADYYQLLPMQPTRLGFLAGGREDQLPNSVEVGIKGVRNPAATGERNEFLIDLEEVDWAWLVQVLLSFAAIVLTFDAFSGEKQDGTLRQIAANSVSRGTVLVGKYLAALIVLLIPLMAGLLVGLLMVGISGQVGLKSGDGLQIGLFALVAVVYLSAVVLLSFLISTRTHQPGTSLVVLLVLWTGMVVVTPAAGGALLNSPFFALRTPEEVGRQGAAMGQEVESRRGLKRHYVDKGDDPETRKTVAVEREKMEVARQVWSGYMREKTSAVAAVRRLLLISPAEAFVHAGEGIAGTGLTQVVRFLDQAEEYRQTFEAFFQAEDRRDPDSFHLFYHVDYMSAKPVGVEQIPRFQEREIDWREGLAAAGGPLAILLLYNGILFLAAYLAFLRYDIQ